MRRTARSPSTSRRAKVQPWCSSTAIRRRRAPSRASSTGRWGGGFDWSPLISRAMANQMTRRIRAPIRFRATPARFGRSWTRSAFTRRASWAGAWVDMWLWKWRRIFRKRAGSSFSARRRSPSRRRLSEAFLPNPAMKFTFQESIDSVEASAYVAAFFKPGFADIPPFFLEDVVAHGRAGAQQSRRQRRLRRATATRSRLFAISKFRSPCCMATKSSWSTARYFGFGRHADPVAGRGADDPRRRACAAMGDAGGVRRSRRSVRQGDDLKLRGPIRQLQKKELKALITLACAQNRALPFGAPLHSTLQACRCRLRSDHFAIGAWPALQILMS